MKERRELKGYNRYVLLDVNDVESEGNFVTSTENRLNGSTGERENRAITVVNIMSVCMSQRRMSTCMENLENGTIFHSLMGSSLTFFVSSIYNL